MALNHCIKPIDPHNEFLKWKLYCHTHSKSILELNPQLNAVVRKYSIKQLHELSIACPSIKTQVDDYLKMFLRKGQAEKIASEFNVDMYCIYEDFVELVEMLYKAAEEAYQDEICEDNMEKYLEIIAIYRLIIDMTDLTVLWKEKDENIRKFQLFCKYRVVNIMDRKEKPAIEKDQNSIGRELEDLENEVGINHNENEAEKKDKDKTDEELIEEFTIKVNRNKRMCDNNALNKDSEKTDEELIEEFCIDSTKKDNDTKDKVIKNAEKLREIMQNDIKALNTQMNDIYKTDEELMAEYINDEKKTAKEKKVESKPQYNKLIKDIGKIYKQPGKAKVFGIQNNTIKGKASQAPLNNQNKKGAIKSNANKPVVVNSNNSKGQSNQRAVNQKGKESNNNQKKKQSTISSSNNQHNNSFTKKRSNAIKDEYYLSVIESMMEETNKIPQIENQPIELPQKESIDHPQHQHQHQHQHHKQLQLNENIIDINADDYFESEDKMIITPFKQITTPMLSKYKYPGNCKYTKGLPVKFKSDDYSDMINCIQKLLLPMIEKDIQCDKNGKALHESEMILYYLSNIIP